MQLQDTQLTKYSVIYFIKDLLYNAGFSTADYRVTNSYPYTSTSVSVMPLVVVDSGPAVAVPYQLSSVNVNRYMFFIDVFAKSDSQRDDVSDIIFDSLKEERIPIYDFNTGFPTIIGNYTGITEIGSLEMEGNPSMLDIHPSIEEAINMFQHHKLIQIRGDLKRF